MSNYLHKILISGGNGQLAWALRRHELAEDFQVTVCSHEQMDITNVVSIKAAIKNISPDIIINTAAYTAVDKAEEDIDHALQINQMGAKNLAILCQENGIPLIHISTDYVFSGKQDLAYCEDDDVGPVNFYGKSKFLGEQAVLQHCEQSIILRVSGIFSEYGNNFFKTILKLAQEKKQLQIVSDQVTCPTYSKDIAAAIYTIIKDMHHYGAYHFCSADPVSWYEFAKAIIGEVKQSKSLLAEEINPISTQELNYAAQRPAYSALDCRKIARDYGLQQPSWQAGIKDILINSTSLIMDNSK